MKFVFSAFLLLMRLSLESVDANPTRDGGSTSVPTVIDENSELMTPNTLLNNQLPSLDSQNDVVSDATLGPDFPTPPITPLFQLPLPNKKILVLDLDDTMMQSLKPQEKAAVERAGIELLTRVDGKPFCARPGLVPFLQALQGNFNLVLFTGSAKIYADRALEAMRISHFFPMDSRLYKDKVERGFASIKNLEKLGYSLKKVVAIDDMISTFFRQVDMVRMVPTNGLLVKPMRLTAAPSDYDSNNNNEADSVENIEQRVAAIKQENADLLQFLNTLAPEGVTDVRPLIIARNVALDNTLG